MKQNIKSTERIFVKAAKQTVAFSGGRTTIMVKRMMTKCINESTGLFLLGLRKDPFQIMVLN